MRGDEVKLYSQLSINRRVVKSCQDVDENEGVLMVMQHWSNDRIDEKMPEVKLSVKYIMLGYEMMSHFYSLTFQ